MRTNEFDQPVGEPVTGWTARATPSREPMIGRTVTIEPLDVERHLSDLYRAFAASPAANWTYLPYGPFTSESDLGDWMYAAAISEDPLFHGIVERASGKAIGVASYLRIAPEAGVIEVGHITWSARLQRSAMATEAMYLMMRRAFDELGYRRYEWKCDALNAPSRRAATRLGFQHDGVFEQSLIYKERNRDTAWYSILDRDWPVLKAGFEAWLAPDNFGADGEQVQALSAFM